MTIFTSSSEMQNQLFNLQMMLLSSLLSVLSISDIRLISACIIRSAVNVTLVYITHNDNVHSCQDRRNIMINPFYCKIKHT